MNKAIIAAGLLLATATASTAQSPTPSTTQTPTPATYPTTPGYDRPSADNHEAGGKQHVVYWSDFFDRFSFTPQNAADANSADQIMEKPKHRDERHPHRKHKA